eukprot:4760651-Amphidinium_carterae.1
MPQPQRYDYPKSNLTTKTARRKRQLRTHYNANSSHHLHGDDRQPPDCPLSDCTGDEALGVTLQWHSQEREHRDDHCEPAAPLQPRIGNHH